MASIKLSNGAYVLLSASFLSIIYNFAILPFRYNFFNNTSIGLYYNIIGEILIVIATLIVFLGAFSFSRILLKLWVAIFITGSAFFSYYIAFYKIVVDEVLIGTLFETDTNEVLFFLSYKLYIWLFFFWLVPFIFLIFKVKFTQKADNFLDRIKDYSFSLIAPIVVALVCYLSSMYFNNTMHQHARGFRLVYALYTPFNYSVSLWQYFVRVKSYKANESEIFNKYNFKFSKDSKFANKKYNVVLIIGESDRADRHSLNGYKRNTNPLLSKEPNLTSFKNAYSCAPLSKIAVNCILSHKNKAEFSFPPQDKNIISVFKELGFNTAFLSSQSMYERGINSFQIASQDASIKAFSSTLRSQADESGQLLDIYLLPHIQNILNKNPDGNFIVLYLVGSHGPYRYRYPKEFAIFDNDNSYTKIQNEYDNSLLYTDYVLSEIIKLFNTQTPAFIYYVADHGESLGENGIIGHGFDLTNPPIEQSNVMQLFWANKSMITLLGSKYTNLVSKSKDYVSHDNVFYSLTGCLDIDFSIKNNKLNLCFK
jgi:lipid A ethanolaminephosphotransferase